MSLHNLSQATTTILSSLLMDVKNGNIRRCESLGMSVEEIRALSQLSLDELHYLSQSHVSVLDVTINHENFWLMLNQARIEQKRMLMIDRALELGGSMELMEKYFGMSPSEVSARRRLMGIETRQGRTQSLSEPQDTSLWPEWKTAGLSSPDSHQALEVMMLAAEQYSLSLTAVWTRVCQWCREAKAGRKADASVRKET
ncbi:DUF2857 domain-containing protein [Erwinia amylovora]|uniref:DUF2857 domain-containing protein n=1 Tax=Erwinia amylovora TaxID=552 RepID=UPI001D093C2E|nr:DUF2857 domain-containing protein [Erwinia amylovora]UDJ86365.1 DUF2857 domain-containing protein [Erwinia amylovora]UDJ97824.1 DUF2857 domain-containing protein [Erwinia amylovora]UDK90116.1 DUF2857 domain-containing protein [Erwinia amylovora]UDK93509.1 DUF2857 domain-containing protein [Erwinia amylovora]UOD74342.1 DUF2857 domain-containing protein [Erwinia amylovora]